MYFNEKYHNLIVRTKLFFCCYEFTITRKEVTKDGPELSSPTIELIWAGPNLR